MAYSADSFTALEVPTLTKMNKLWANDASFNDGTGIASNAIKTAHITDGNVTSLKLAEAFIRGRQQENTTNTTKTGQLLQWGWNYVRTNGSGLTNGTRAVVFPTPFSGVPFLFPSFLSYSGATVPTSQNSLGGATGVGPILSIAPITASGFTAWIYQPSSSDTYFTYTWLAIGPA